MAIPDDARQLQEWIRVVEVMPEAVRQAIPLRLWDRTRLYALDLPVRNVAVEHLRWMLDVPLWAVKGIAFQVTPNQVRAHPGLYPDQYRRVLAADLSYPVHVMWHNERWTILDGVHRLLRTSIEGHDHIAAMVLSRGDYWNILVAGDNVPH